MTTQPLIDFDQKEACPLSSAHGEAVNQLIAHRRKYRGRYVVWTGPAEDILLAVEADASANGTIRRGVIWARPHLLFPEERAGWRPFELRNEENCDNYGQVIVARKKGYRPAEVACRRYCLCDYTKQFDGGVRLREVPNWVLNLSEAKQATLVFLDCPPPTWTRSLELTPSELADNLSQDQQRLVMALTQVASAGELQSGCTLYEQLDAKIGLSTIACLPEWMPRRYSLNNPEPWIDSSRQGSWLQKAPDNYEVLFDALRKDAKTHMTGGIPERVTVRVMRQRRGNEALVVLVNVKILDPAVDPSRLSWLAKKPVLLSRGWAAEWEPVLKRLGMREATVEPRPPNDKPRDRLYATAQRLIREGRRVSQAELARESGVGRSLVHYHKLEKTVARALNPPELGK